MFRLELLYRRVLTTLPEPESSPKLERYKNTQTKSWHGTFFIWTHDDKKQKTWIWNLQVIWLRILIDKNML